MAIYKFDQKVYEGETIGDVTYRRLRADIVHGQLKPGEKLRLEYLKEKYALSITTLRELLSKLTAEELVTAEGQRGFEVAKISRAGLTDIANLRILLETNALRQSILLGDLDWEGNVISAHHKLAAVEKDIVGGNESIVHHWVRRDWEFHQAIIQSCNAPSLMKIHSSVFDRFIRYHMLVLSFRGEPAADEHVQLRDLVIKRETEDAVELLTAHIHAGVEHILSTGLIPE